MRGPGHLISFESFDPLFLRRDLKAGHPHPRLYSLRHPRPAREGWDRYRRKPQAFRRSRFPYPIQLCMHDTETRRAWPPERGCFLERKKKHY